MTKGLAFTALLHGDAEEYMLYALVLGRQLKRHWSTGVDRVLLLGPGKFSESQDSHNALKLAGWTHLKPVDMIDKPHLDKTGSKRHRLVFMKLWALELSYKHVLFLDLDLLPRANANLAELFNIQAPAGKYHGYTSVELHHGKIIPLEALTEFWCPNAGVMRLDPKPTPEARRDELAGILKDLDRAYAHWSSYLPEQYYLAQKMQGWHHLGSEYNYEISFGLEKPNNCWHGNSQLILESIRVWHYSGKCGLQPWMFTDFEEPCSAKEWLKKHYTTHDPGGVVTAAFSEWLVSLHALLEEEPGSCMHALVHRISQRAKRMRNWCDYYRVCKLALQCCLLEQCLSGCRRYADCDDACTFEQYATYFRNLLPPGPDNDYDYRAIAKARKAWDTADPKEQCSECEVLRSR